MYLQSTTRPWLLTRAALQSYQAAIATAARFSNLVMACAAGAPEPSPRRRNQGKQHGYENMTYDFHLIADVFAIWRKAALCAVNI